MLNAGECSLGGMCGAIVTSPFDVVKTRLQSSLFRTSEHVPRGAVASAVEVLRSGAGSGATAVLHGGGGGARIPQGGLLYNFVETGHIIRYVYTLLRCPALKSSLTYTCRDIYVHESPRALFKGLGPTLVGVVPARSINFFTYGNGKQVIASAFNDGVENSYVHLGAAALAGVVTSTATNPIWVVKTRLQLVQGQAASGSRGSWACIKQILREEGVRGFYKGMTASYLGVTEGTIQWVWYEKLKKMRAAGEGEARGGWKEWAGMLGSAGTAKCVASLITYPHEVRPLPIFIGTRLTPERNTGHPNTAPPTSTKRRPAKIHRALPNAARRHRRRGRPVSVRRSQRASYASHTELGGHVRDL